MFRHYRKTAIRNLMRTPFLSLVNIGGLSVGLACCMLILLYAKDELSFDSFHKNIGRLYQLTCHRYSKAGEDKHFAIAAMVQGPAFKEAIPEIRAFTRVNPQPMLIRTGSQTFNETVTWADEDFFTFFSFPLLSGDPASVLADQHSVVLSREAAAKYFGRNEGGKGQGNGVENAIGKRLELEIDGKFQSFLVRGIAKDPPGNSSIQFSLVLPFHYLFALHPDNGWMWVSYPTYFELAPGADLEKVAAGMNRVFRSAANEELTLNQLMGYTDQFVWGLEPLRTMHLQRDYEGSPGASNPVYAYILTGIAFFILLIACINFINLSVAQSLRRSREIGLRKVIGALRIQLIRQFLSESFYTCLIAFGMAMGLAAWWLPFFNEVADKKLSLGYLFDGWLVTSFLLLFFVVFLGAGFYPAIVLSGLNPVRTMVSRAKLTGKNYLGRGLVVLQFGLASFLIICTVFLYRQLDYLTGADLGYKDRNVVEMTIAGSVMDPRFANTCKMGFAGIPGVEEAAVQNIGKFGGKTICGGREVQAIYLHVDEHYLSALTIPLRQGRNFRSHFQPDSTGAVIVNETFAKEAGLQNPIGAVIDYMNFPGWGNRKVTIIGVMRDYHVESLRERIKPLVLTQEPGLPFGKFLLKMNAARVSVTMGLIGKAYQRMVPFHPFQYAFTKDLNARNYEAEATMKKIVGFGALLTIVISATGLFGLTTLSIHQRTKEIGIRKVLGAGLFEICFLLSSDYMRWVMLAFVLAAPLAWIIVHGWLEHFAYRISMSGWVFLFSGGITCLTGILTVGFQTVRAARMNPTHAISVV